MTDTFKLTPNETVRLLSSDAGAIEVEGTWGPGGSPPPKHFHPAQDERFEVLEGTLTARVDGEQRELQAGEVLEIARGPVSPQSADQTEHSEQRHEHGLWPGEPEHVAVLGQVRPVGERAGHAVPVSYTHLTLPTICSV